MSFALLGPTLGLTRFSYDFDIDETNHQLTIFIASSLFLTNIPQFMSIGNHSNLLPIQDHSWLHLIINSSIACYHCVSMRVATKFVGHVAHYGAPWTVVLGIIGIKNKHKNTKNYKTRTWNWDMMKNKLAWVSSALNHTNSWETR